MNSTCKRPIYPTNCFPEIIAKTFCNCLNLIFNSLQSQHNKNLTRSQFFKIICFETSLSYHHLTYRPRFHTVWKDLWISILHIGRQISVLHIGRQNSLDYFPLITELGLSEFFSINFSLNVFLIFVITLVTRFLIDLCCCHLPVTVNVM